VKIAHAIFIRTAYDRRAIIGDCHENGHDAGMPQGYSMNFNTARDARTRVGKDAPLRAKFSLLWCKVLGLHAFSNKNGSAISCFMPDRMGVIGVCHENYIIPIVTQAYKMKIPEAFSY